MKTAATILLTAIVGIHCSAPVDDDAAKQEVPITEVPPAPPQRDAPPTGPLTVGTFDGNTGVFVPTMVTSSVDGDDGATYVAGTFHSKIVFGTKRILSRGQDDVFLARLEPTGEIGWAVTVGSTKQERQPAVSFEDGRVKLIGLTNGEVDCGAGPMPAHDAAMTFYCAFEPSAGEILLSVQMPTGQ